MPCLYWVGVGFPPKANILTCTHDLGGIAIFGHLAVGPLFPPSLAC